jgi:hypothetical protein
MDGRRVARKIFRCAADPRFARGGLPRIALALLREASEPPAVRVVAPRALALRGCHTPDRRTFKLKRIRVAQLFGRLEGDNAEAG